MVPPSGVPASGVPAAGVPASGVPASGGGAPASGGAPPSGSGPGGPSLGLPPSTARTPTRDVHAAQRAISTAANGLATPASPRHGVREAGQAGVRRRAEGGKKGGA